MNQNPCCKYHSICDITYSLPPGACEISEFIDNCPRYAQYEELFGDEDPLKGIERMFKEGKIIGEDKEK